MGVKGKRFSSEVKLDSGRTVRTTTRFIMLFDSGIQVYQFYSALNCNVMGFSLRTTILNHLISHC